MRRIGSIEVLVVDDSPAFLAAACDWLASHPSMLLVGAARDGAEAIEAVGRLSPDLVLLDTFMPVMDGFEATRAIKSTPGAPVVILLSVHDGRDIERAAIAAGAERFLPKSQFASLLPDVLRDLFGIGACDGSAGRRESS